MNMRYFALCLTALFLSTTAAVAQDVRPGWAVYQTKHSFKSMVGKLRSAIKDAKMLNVTRASASAGARGRKITIPGNMIVGVYRNDYAVRMLEASIDAGIEAPIRFYLTENEDKTTRLAYRTPSSVFAPYMDEGGDKLKELAAELDGVFDQIAKAAIK
jgi:uncharacterized protein (DUF302 family)